MNAQFHTVRFNNRRYNRLTSGSAGAGPGGGAETGSVAGQLGDLEPVDNCINSVLGQVSNLSSISSLTASRSCCRRWS